MFVFRQDILLKNHIKLHKNSWQLKVSLGIHIWLFYKIKWVWSKNIFSVLKIFILKKQTYCHYYKLEHFFILLVKLKRICVWWKLLRWIGWSLGLKMNLSTKQFWKRITEISVYKILWKLWFPRITGDAQARLPSQCWHHRVYHLLGLLRLAWQVILLICPLLAECWDISD